MSRDKKIDLNIIKQAAILYDKNLLNKNIIFVYLKDNRTEYYEVIFLKEHFKHLTGVKTNLNAYEFFYRSKNNRLRIEDFEYKDNTSALKIDNLIKAMNLSSFSKMIGEFKHNKIFVSLKKVTGNNNLILGFDEGENINYPKTLLKGDVRDYTQKVYRIIGILSKNISDKKYNTLNYIAKNINVKRLISNKELKNKMNVDILIHSNIGINQ